jgi:hypothetical protein
MLIPFSPEEEVNLIRGWVRMRNSRRWTSRSRQRKNKHPINVAWIVAPLDDMVGTIFSFYGSSTGHRRL